jgi:anti-anti-sigma factor
MNLTTDRVDGITILQIAEPRLTYPILGDLASTGASLIDRGETRLVIDLASVGYVDSATIGCLMDLYRQTTAAGGSIKLAGVQKRVETMLTMTGAHNFLEMHPDEASAVRSFGS